MKTLPGGNISLSSICLQAFAFLLPVYSPASVIPLVIAVVLFFDRKFRRKETAAVLTRIAFFFFLYYSAHVAGLIHSQNLSYALLDLQIKLPFLLVPLAFTVAESELRQIPRALIAGCIVSALILLVFSVRDYMITGYTESFMYGRLSHWHHPTYISAIFNLALVFLLHDWFYGERKTLKVVAGIFLLAMILMFSSRTSIAVTYFTLVLFPVFTLGKTIFSMNRLPRFMLFLFSIFFLLFVSLRFNTRFAEVRAQVQNVQEQKLESPEPTSTNIRFHVWDYSSRLILRHPFTGVGTGDLHTELAKVYAEEKYQPAIEKNLNPHNQFLHTGVILGIPGIMLMAGMLLFILIVSVRRRDWLSVTFISIVILNCMTESFLERQAGVLFFTFFTGFFMLRMNQADERT